MTKGHVNTWDYIQEQCQHVVNEPGRLHHRSRSQQGKALDPINFETPVSPGRYSWVRWDEPLSPVSYAIGPRLAANTRSPSTRAPPSTASTPSGPSRAPQTPSRGPTGSFPENLVARENLRNLITDDYYGQAAHIIPASRPEWYLEALEEESKRIPTNDVSFGLLLSYPFHRAWEQGWVALYPDPTDESTLVVHVFYESHSGLAAYHGTRIPRSRFHCLSDQELPNRRLLAFHYKQCAIQFIRGFSA